MYYTTILISWATTKGCQSASNQFNVKDDMVAPTNSISPATHVICPECAEYVRKEAKTCKHCGAKLIPIENDEPEKSPGPMATLGNLTPRQIIMIVLVGAILVAMLKA